MHERLFLRLDGDPLYAPETTVPAGTMREFTVPAALRGQVAHLITYNERFPVGAVVRGHLSGLSVTLRPGASLALFRVPAHELAEQVVDWDELVGAGHRGLCDRLHGSDRDTERARMLCATLQTMTSDVDSEERRKADRAATLLRADGDLPSVGTVAASVGVGERRLQQIFRSQFGLSPGAWRRLARVQRCLRLLRQRGGARWPELALTAGFYDQAHLVNEFRALCGLTPGQFLQRFGSGFSKTA